MIELKGITWDHARGYDPMVATAQAYMQTHPDVSITWQRRSLKEFGDFPVEKLAEVYDLLVIDHPFIGFAAAQGCFLPLDQHINADFLADQAANSVGQSHVSYQADGHQWALAIDAAAQISAYRADLLDTLPQTWDDVLQLAKRLHAAGKARVCIPLVPIDSLMSLFSMAASTGNEPCATSDYFVDRETGRWALNLMLEFLPYLHPKSLEWNPIAAYDAMSTTDEIAYVPLLFAYVNYGRAGFRDHLVRFGDVPKQDPQGKSGILGGTGYAISSICQHVDVAADYGKFVASPDVQRGLYFSSGGQPGHRAAWLDDANNAASNNFFRDTLAAHDNAYLRPRYNGYTHFQDVTWYWVHDFLKEAGNPDTLLDRLDDFYRKTLAGDFTPD